jgi:GPN-loop GTPase
MEFLEANLDWLDEQLKALQGESGRCREECVEVTTLFESLFTGTYLLFDFPGQAELFTHHGSVTRILHHLTKAGFQVNVAILKQSNCEDPTWLVCRSLRLSIW